MVPAVLGLLGAGGAGLAAAPALQVLTWPLLGLNLWTLGRGWHLQLTHGGATVWQRRAQKLLVFSTLMSTTLWGLRFAGVLGEAPL